MEERVILRSIRELCSTEEDLVKHIVKDLPSMGKDLGFEINGIDKEVRIEGFLADRIVRCKNGEIIVIEAQLGESNHDHVGKLLTYVANKGANRGYLICESARQEHVNTLKVFGQGKLNIVEVYLVGGGNLAYRIVSSKKQRGPSTGEDWTGGFPWREFWQGFIDYVLGKGLGEFEGKNPHKNSYWSISIGIPHVSFAYAVGKDWGVVSLVVPTKYTLLVQYMNTWKDKVSYTVYWNRPNDVTGFGWRKKVEGYHKNPKDWNKFYQTLLDLYLDAKKETADLIEGLRR